MSVSDCCWHWQDTVLAAGCQRVLSLLSIAYTSNISVYMLRAAIYSASNFITIFVTKYHTLLHMLQTSALAKAPLPLVRFCLHWAIPSLPHADVLYG